jgi:hypothetical protein
LGRALAPVRFLSIARLSIALDSPTEVRRRIVTDLTAVDSDKNRFETFPVLFIRRQ